MISHEDFARLRLLDFVDEVSPLDCWQFMGRKWVGEAVGFSEWLRPMDDAESLGSLALDLVDLPRDVVASVLDRLQLELEPGLTIGEIRQRLGEPREAQSFVRDRRSYEFLVGDSDAYSVSCTVHEDEGLIYVVVMTVQ